MKPCIASISLLHLLSHHYNGCKSYICFLKLQAKEKIKYILRIYKIYKSDCEKSIIISLPGMKPQLPKAVSGSLKCKKAQV